MMGETSKWTYIITCTKEYVKVEVRGCVDASSGPIAKYLLATKKHGCY